MIRSHSGIVDCYCIKNRINMSCNLFLSVNILYMHARARARTHTHTHTHTHKDGRYNNPLFLRYRRLIYLTQSVGSQLEGAVRKSIQPVSFIHAVSCIQVAIELTDSDRDLSASLY